MTEVPRRQGIGVSKKLNQKILFSAFVGSGNVFWKFLVGNMGEEVLLGNMSEEVLVGNIE